MMLGNINEKLLCSIFENVQRMPHTNHGFDFICNKDKKIDAKGGCLSSKNRWYFFPGKNKIADYFACVAYDNKTSLNPVHFWLIPGNIVNKYCSFSIRNDISGLTKWKKYERPLDKILTCCNILKIEK
jgi:hypothetical protein